MNNLIANFNLYLLTEKRASTNTVLAYIRDIDQFSLFLDKHKLTVPAVGLKELRLFIESLYHLKAASRARKISSLKVFYSYLELHHDMVNVAQQLVMPMVEERLPHYLSEEEVGKLLMHANQEPTLRNQLLIALLYATGGRITEVITIKVNNICIDSRMITLKGKRAKERVVPIPKSVIKLIKQYIRKEHISSPYLFSVQRDERINHMHRETASQILRNIWKKTGIKKKIWPHQLRHSYATHMLKRGANLRQLQTLLGHERLASVEIYTHLDTDHIRKEYDKKHPRA